MKKSEILLAKAKEKGVLRPIDQQFALFVGRLMAPLADARDAEDSVDEALSANDALMLISALLSAEIGQGNVCLALSSDDRPVSIGAKFADWFMALQSEALSELNQALAEFDWIRLLTEHPLVGTPLTAGGALEPATPPSLLIFDGQRLYMHRYWSDEYHLAALLNGFERAERSGNAEPYGADPKLRDILDDLFKTDYSHSFNALVKFRANQALLQDAQSTEAPMRWQGKEWLIDMLDIVRPDELDWQAIETAILAANQISDFDCLEQLIPLSARLNWQKVAAAVAISRPFSVISGGPGTGKTTTVTKLLVALIRHKLLTEGKAPLIRLVAPTGKAAARLTESIGKAVAELGLAPEIAKAIPSAASTIHLLLGSIANSTQFRHHKDNPLALDVLVVDESSMVDLSLMYKLISALPTHARVVLLGDKDQLASVDAGAVLGDICAFYAEGYSQRQGQLLAELTGFDALSLSQGEPRFADNLCMLTKSYRFHAKSGVGQLAKAVNNGDKKALAQVMAQGFKDIELYGITPSECEQLLTVMDDEYSKYLHLLRSVDLGNSKGEEAEHFAQTQMLSHAKKVLDEFNKVRLLCAVRQGEFGIEGFNQKIEQRLRASGHLVFASRAAGEAEQWFDGRPVMITRNDHSMSLFNGDIGICMLDRSDPLRRLKVYFELPDGSIKAVLPSKVPEHETAFAMTIHKSQGSEFKYTLMILPAEFNPVINRELIYTGITRAKDRLALYASPEILRQGMLKRTQRASGLMDRLRAS